MTPLEMLMTDIKAAMRARAKLKLSTLRMLLAEMKNEKIATGQEVDEKTFLRLVQRSVKQRKEAATKFRQGERIELAEKEESEMEILQEYLPQAVSEEELRAAVEEFVAQENLEGPRGLGAVMKEMMGRFAGRVDGGALQKIARDVLIS